MSKTDKDKDKNDFIFHNNYYDDALLWSTNYAQTPEIGYSKVSVPGKSDQIIIHQNNTILALLSSLHHRISLIESKFIQLEDKLSKSTSQTDWKAALDTINKDLNNLSIGKLVARRTPNTYSFLTYK